MTDEQIGPEDVAAAIRAHQAPSEVVDDTGAPAPAEDDAPADAASSAGAATPDDRAPRGESGS